MILDETVQIKLNSQTYDYWISLGYPINGYIDTRRRLKKFKRGSLLTVKVSDLPTKSNVRVRAKCMTCGLERALAYSSYTEICWKCNLSSQVGVKHPRYLQRVKTQGDIRAFDLYLQRKYNITSEYYYQLLEEQNYKCGACGQDQATEGRRFAVDHNHLTGKVRGILCQPCNTALGLLKEDRKIIMRLVAYIEKDSI